MTIQSWANTAKYIDDKLEFVLKTYLADSVRFYNTDKELGDAAIPVPKQYEIGVNSVALESTYNALDLFPAINVYSNGSTNTVNDFMHSQDNRISYSLVAIIGGDGGDISWAQRSATYLANLAMTVIERYLPDSPGDTLGLTSIYRVDPVNTSANATIPVKDSGFYISAFEIRFDVYTRVDLSYEPSKVNNRFSLKPYLESKFEPSSLTLEFDTGVSLINSLAPSDSDVATCSSAQLAAASSIIIDFPGYSDGSDVFITNQRTKDTAQTTVSSEQAINTTLLSTIQSTDIFTLSVVDADTNVPGFYLWSWFVF